MEDPVLEELGDLGEVEEEVKITEGQGLVEDTREEAQEAIGARPEVVVGLTAIAVRQRVGHVLDLMEEI